jgi:serine protease AprX
METHQLLSNPPVILGAFDCVNGGADCATGSHLITSDVYGHGTSTAAIICANNNQGDEYRGVTPIRVVSFRVGTEQGYVDRVAALMAFQMAVRFRILTIAAPIGDPGADELSSMSQAADKAFDTGTATIAGNGNDFFAQGDGTVHAPANAHKAIGVGAFDVSTRDTWERPEQDTMAAAFQSRGPTRDGRYKPDIQAPTRTCTAAGGPNTDNIGRYRFEGTSGATPYAAGVAILARALYGYGTHFAISPGQVYVYLILSTLIPFGTHAHPLLSDPINNINGAGKLRMTPGWHYFGTEEITARAHIDIPLAMPTQPNILDP